MKAIDLINDLRGGLNAAKAQGQTTIPVVALENYLTQMESAAASATAQEEGEAARGTSTFRSRDGRCGKF